MSELFSHVVTAFLNHLHEDASILRNTAQFHILFKYYGRGFWFLRFVIVTIVVTLDELSNMDPFEIVGIMFLRMRGIVEIVELARRPFKIFRQFSKDIIGAFPLIPMHYLDRVAAL